VRSLSLVSLLITLVVVAFLWTRSAQETGLAPSDAPSDAAKVAAAFSLQQAAPALEAWRSTTGTFAGASLPASSGVTVVRADAASFCLQAGSGPNVQHLAGPEGNAPIDGPC
jgi:hypothetical protein